MADDFAEWNRGIMAEFRENGGKVGGMFEGAPVLILHSTGAKSGEPREHPLMYQQVGDEMAVFASKAGAPTHPAWYHNVVAHPDCEVEVGTERVPVRARVAEGAEREEIWTRQMADYPNFAEYQEKVEGVRVIPVVLLARR